MITLTTVWLLLAFMLFLVLMPVFVSTEELILICFACIIFASAIVYIIVRWKRKLTDENRTRKKKRMMLTVSVVIVFVCFAYIPYFIHLPVSEKKCSCEEPVFRWKYAIYCGECYQGEGSGKYGNCNFQKIEGTGCREYFGLRNFECPCSTP